VRVLCRQHNLKEAHQHLSRLLELSEIDLPADTYAEVQNTIAWYWMASDNLEAALEFWDRSLQEQNTLMASVRISNLIWKATCLSRLNQIETAKELLLRSLEESREHAYKRGVLSSLCKLALIELNAAHVGAAEFLIMESYSDPDYARYGEHMPERAYVSARLHTLRSELPEAHVALTEAIDLFERMGMRRELAEAREELARLEAQMAEAAE